MDKWNIGIISTDYDLKEERKTLIGLLENYKETFTLAFEKNDYPVEAGLHSHDVCLSVVDYMDIAFVIINKRYGGLYVGDSVGNAGVSITYAEFKRLKEKEKIIIPIVNINTWNERHKFLKDFRNRTNKKQKKEQFSRTYKFQYIEKYGVIQFLEEIHKSATDNFMIFYNTPDELPDKVLGRLRGLSRYFLRIIQNKQVDEIKRKKTFLSLNWSIGDFFNKKLYMNPRVKTSSGDKICLSSDEQQKDTITSKLYNNQKILILGEPGAGKSTLLAKSFLNMCKMDDNNLIPVYIQFRGRNKNEFVNIRKYYEECFECYYKRRIYPFIEFSNIKFVFFMDGLDEFGENLNSEEIEKLSELEFFKYPVMMTCREKYAYQYFNSTILGSKFDDIYRIEKWLNKDAEEYINRYIGLISEEKQTKFKGILTSKEMMKLFHNPLFTNLVLFTIEEGSLNIPFDITDKVDCFRYAIGVLAKREIEKHGFEIAESTCIKMWMDISWKLYESRKYNTIMNCQDMETYLVEKYNVRDTKRAERIITALFEINVIKNTIIGCIHEQLMEYLVSLVLMHAVLKEKNPYPEFLEYVIRPEINFLFLGLYEKQSIKEKQRFQEILWNKYCDIVCSDNIGDIMKRIRILYYLTRIHCNNIEKIVSWVKKVETNSQVLISMYSGCIKSRYEGMEEEFYNRLHEDSEFECMYRGYHLIYYGDALEDTFKFPYYDKCQFQWNCTCDALVQQFESDKKDYYNMMRIELYVMGQLIETRKNVGPLTDKKLEIIRNTIEKLAYNEKFQKEVKKEFEKLVHVWSKYK